MLPFSSIEFFVIIAILLLWMYLAKHYLAHIFDYSTALFITIIIFISFYYPKPIHIFLFFLYSYLSFRILIMTTFINHRLISSLILLFPMIMFKVFENFSSPFYRISEIIFFPGISYVSFRLLSLYLDTKDDPLQISIISFINYLLFIPTLLIGPIDRYHRFKMDMDLGYEKLKSSNFLKGIKYIRWGILFKFILAELINHYWFDKFDLNEFSTRELILDSYIYYLYLIFDFSGYSFMAVGLGILMGINVPMNFMKPLLAKNPKDFWKRFHITLGAWLKDYFFIPIYKYLRSFSYLKRFHLFCQNISLFMTFFLMGCWNGLSPNFIICGSIFGVYSMLYNTYEYYCKKNGKDIIFGQLPEFFVTFISRLIMFNLVSFALYVFSGRAIY